MSELLTSPNALPTITSRETVIENIGECYRKLMMIPGCRGDRISGILPLVAIEVDHEWGASILEREYEGSQSYAVSLYEMSQPSFISKGFFTTLLDGRQAYVKPVDLLFTTTSDVDRLHELCIVVEASIEHLLQTVH